MTRASDAAWERFKSRCTDSDLEAFRSDWSGDGIYELPDEWSAEGAEPVERASGNCWIPVGFDETGVDWVRACVDAGSMPVVAGFARALAAECAASSVTGEESARLTRRLASGFEELTLLLRLVSSMPTAESVADFAKGLLEELIRGLPYEWAALSLRLDLEGIGHGLDEVSIAGMLPCPPNVLESLLELAMPRVDRDRTVVLRGEECDVVAPQSGQIVAQAIRVDGETVGALFLGEKRCPDDAVTTSDVKVVEAGGSMLSGMIGAALLTAEQERMFVATVQTVVASIEAKDPYTCGHASRVGHLSERLALAAGWSEAEAARARLAGLFHDVGKVGISDEIIRASGKLTEDQFEQIKLHPEIGHHILSGLPGLEDILPAVLYHHERIDGKGYPRGITGERIPMIARIVCLADAFDAMSSNRQYRFKMTREEVFEEIRNCRGTHFDAELVDTFLEKVDLGMFDEMIAHPERFKKTAPIIERAHDYFQARERGTAPDEHRRAA